MDIKALKENLFEEYLEEVEKENYAGIISWGPEKGAPWYHKSDSEIEELAEKKVNEFMVWFIKRSLLISSNIHLFFYRKKEFNFRFKFVSNEFILEKKC